MRNFVLRHPLLFMLQYFVFFMTFFDYLQGRTDIADWIVHCPLDEWIPFVKYAIIPYAVWYLWIPFSLYFFMKKSEASEFWRTVLSLFGGFTFALIFYLIVVNKVFIRPHIVEGDDVFAWAVRLLYATDPSTNVCPSLHVFSTVMVNLAWHRYLRRTETEKRCSRLLMEINLMSISIIASTMLLKQHSVIDVVCGILLVLIADFSVGHLLANEDFLPHPSRHRLRHIH